MLTKIDDKFLKPYFKGTKKHKAYDDTVKIMEDMMLHANGLKPGTLLTDRRPHEDPDVQVYREKIFVAITKPVVSKIVSSLGKIRKSDDWNIKYNPATLKVVPGTGESLQDYCEKQYPYFTSITNWVFSVLLKNYLVDPNALCCVMPLDVGVSDKEYLEPFSYIFNSNNVHDYVQDDYAVIYSTDKSTYTEGDVTYYDGDIFYVFTTAKIQRWEQTKRDKTMELMFDYNHKLGVLPVMRLGGIFKEAKDTTFIYESRIDAILPHLTEALREYSDLQAEIVQHIHSEKWVYVSQECKTCKGAREVKQGSSSVKCKDCKGTGSDMSSPYNYRMIKATMPGQTQVPIPPAGFIEKQVEIAKLQDERIDKHKFNALAALNMEFLYQTPLNQSGKAKEVDRDELNVFVNSIAEDIVALMDKIYFLVNEYRYRVVVKNKKTRASMLPSIIVPSKFDLINSTYLAEELQRAKTNKINPKLINALELDYANKKFSGEPAIKQALELEFKLDPFPAVDEADKSLRLQNGGIRKIDYIVSCYISRFVQQAIDQYITEKKNFYDEAYPEQVKVLEAFAKVVLEEESARSKTMKLIQGNPDKVPAAA